MTYHANKSLNLLQRIIGEGSDSSSGQDWKDGEPPAGLELGQDETDRAESEEEPENVTVDDSSLCHATVMDKMGNTVDSFNESEEVVNRKYEEFLRGGQLIENEEESAGAEVVLAKIDEEDGAEHWPVVTEKSELRQKEHRVKPQKEQREEFENNSPAKYENSSRVQFENNSKVDREDAVIKKKMKPRKKKRKIKKAFIMENGDHVDAKLDGSEQDSVNQENYEQHHPRFSKKEESTDQDSVSDRHEIMSDQGPATQNQKRRKLTKRTQIRKFRSLDINPNLFYEERLQQKYEELKELVHTGISQQQVSRQYLRQMEMLRQQYASVSHGIPPSGRSVLRSRNQQPERSESDHAYSTIRMLQVTNQQRFSRPRPQSAAPARPEQSRIRQSRPKSAAPTKHDQTNGKPDSTYSNSNNSLRNRSYSPRSRRQNGFPDSPRSKSADSDSASEGHHHHSDYQLKDTDNDTIREWLKKKNVLIRRQKAEERKKKREERKKEQAIAKEKEKNQQESQKKVEEWLNAKRLEAAKKKKEERSYRKQEMEERTMQNAYMVTMVSGQGFNYPPAPPMYKTKHVVRPGTTPADMKPKPAPELPVSGEETPDSVRMELNKRRLEEEEKQQTTQAEKIQIEGPHPPTTKFVYKRPVLGRVRLRVRSQTPDKHSEHAGKKEKKVETQMKRDEIKVRKSYDEWLAEKRTSSNERRKDISKQTKVTKSTPELEIREAKLEERRVTEVDSDVNKTCSQADLEEVTHRLVSEVLSSLEDDEEEETEIDHTDSFLKVSGTKTSLSARPQSATTVPVPSLQMSKSPRRPASAKPHSKAVKENGEQNSSIPSFKLPFPPELGVPKHVESRQRKLFSPKLWENPEDGERPEPQGCDAMDRTSSSMVTEESAKDQSAVGGSSQSTFHSQDSLKFKRVSFSETTTVIEEDLPSTDSPSTDAPSTDGSPPDNEEQASTNADNEKQVLSDRIFVTEDS